MVVRSRLAIPVLMLATALLPQPGMAADATPSFVAPRGTATQNSPEGAAFVLGRENSERSLKVAMMDDMPMGGAATQQAPAQGNAPMQAPPPPAQPDPPAAGGMSGMMDDDMPMGGSTMQQMPAQGGAAQAMPMPPTANQPASPAAGGGMSMMDMMRMDPAMQGMPMSPTTPQAGVPASGGMCSMMMDMMKMAPPQQGMPPMQSGAAAGALGSPAARLEGNVAFLRAELRITDAQAAAWEAFAAALRDSHTHLDAARATLEDKGMGADPVAQLEAFENHLTARMEAIRSTRLAFNTLYGQLDEAQKRMVTTTMLPFISVF